MKGLCAMLKGIKCCKVLNKVNRIVKCGSIVWNIKRIVCDLDRIVCNVKLLSEMLKRSGQCWKDCVESWKNCVKRWKDCVRDPAWLPAKGNCGGNKGSVSSGPPFSLSLVAGGPFYLQNILYVLLPTLLFFLLSSRSWKKENTNKHESYI